MEYNFSKKRALVTGASHGLGKYVAESLAASGCTVTACARNIESIPSQMVPDSSELSQEGSILPFRCDVAKEDQVAQLIEYCEDVMGGIDILVNNAAIHGPLGRFADCDWERWKTTLDVNLFGAFNCIHKILPTMVAQNYGKIINLSGGGATTPLPSFSAYTASKVALVRLTETLAIEYKADNIFINAVAPGVLNTRLNQEVINAEPDLVGQKYHKQITDMIEDDYSSMEKAAKLILYLASDISDGITGCLISAVWDNWSVLHLQSDEWEFNEKFKLRRIT